MRWNTAEAYPAARERGGAPRPLVAGQYGRMETTAGFITLGDTDADVIAFSGAPDSVTVAVKTFDAIISYRMRGRDTADTVIVTAGETFAPDVKVEIIRGRNRVPGSAATVQAVGKWLRGADDGQ